MIMLKPKKRFLILCEDEKSSLLYFQSFKKDEEIKRKLEAVDIQVIHPYNYSPLGLVNEAKIYIKKAKREQNKYDHVWLVFDKDGHADIPKAFEEARQSNINIAFSNNCFEYWVLLHFENTSREFNNCDDIIKYIKNKYIKDYDKCKNCFEILKDKMNIAVNNSKKIYKILESDLLEGNKIYELGSSTNIHELVSLIVMNNDKI